MLGAVRRDRVDDVRVLRGVEEPEDQPRRMEAEVAPDLGILEARAGEHSRRVERAGGDHDRARGDALAGAGLVAVLDAGRLRALAAVLDQDALDARTRAQLERAVHERALRCRCSAVDLPALVGQPCRQEPMRVQFSSV